jgi:hypothetical protein
VDRELRVPLSWRVPVKPHCPLAALPGLPERPHRSRPLGAARERVHRPFED